MNLQNLIKQEIEFDEDFTIPPQSHYGEFLKKNSFIAAIANFLEFFVVICSVSKVKEAEK